ncbi:hypothetical protein [Tunturiibacter lichenicola]|uniref:hypothetical protein n=1 Tax=Tunturiibacter lichenicola TaxID=2051959 RepID=UPI003D9AF25E
MISDLDEIVLACRSEVAKTQMHEAVNCYRAGAYRSTIIATWIAVLFDYISKLKELEMSGDNRAASRLAEFDRARATGDIAASLDFERTLVSEARDDFELLSAIEGKDLERLFEDRNRCAHSSMISMDEPYSPSPELARAHMKIAVTVFLQHPPIQGKAALDRVFQDIKSDYFPIEEEQAFDFLRNGPLARARKPLIRSIVIGITKDLLSEFRNQQERGRQFAALKAVGRLYPTDFDAALVEVLPKLVPATPDDKFHLAIRYLRQVGPAWKAMGLSAQIRASTSVRSAPPDTLMKFIGPALAVPTLRQDASLRLKDLSTEQIGRLVKAFPENIFIPRGLEIFSEVKGFRNAEAILEEILVPLAPKLGPDDLSRLIEACEKNDQIHHAFGVPALLQELLKECALDDPRSLANWEKLHKLATSNHFLGEPAPELANALRTRFGFTQPESTNGLVAAMTEEQSEDDDIPF